MNNNKVATVDAAKMAAAAEQAEAKQKAKATKEAATKGVAEDAPPAKATKVEAVVQIWPGLISDSGPSPGWALCLGGSGRNLSGPCGLPGRAFWPCLQEERLTLRDHASSPCSAPPEFRVYSAPPLNFLISTHR